MINYLSFKQPPDQESLVPLIFLITFLLLEPFIVDVTAEPSILDDNLEVEVVAKGANFTSNVAFIGPNDILALEKDTGKIRRIVNSVMLEKPLLDVSVANKKYERGLLGIAIANDSNVISNGSARRVFLYYTESKTMDGTDNCPWNNYCYPGNEPLGNRLYRYDLDEINNKLVNPKLLLNLPAIPGPAHNGGVVAVGPDGNVYVVVGDLLGDHSAYSRTMAQNFPNGSSPDGRAGILRVTQDGQTVDNGILGKNHPQNKYYAYGIRNSFGMDFDPVTGNLWNTENGPEYGDEINLVMPGFNSGWISIQGLWRPQKDNDAHSLRDYAAGDYAVTRTTKVPLVDFGGLGTYADPKFTWYTPVVPTALRFMSSDKLGKQYQNDMFVGDIYGNVYHFDLTRNRTELSLPGPLTDRIANDPEEVKMVRLGEGFGSPLRGVVDIEVGPDGNLYIISYEGTIFRIANRIIAER
jgi:glucose/arabinose dehydrogenase